MNRVLSTLSPSITKMIRLDHSHALVLSHKYRVDASPATKQAIAKGVCLALEIHAQLEEEIFYPALRSVASDNEVLAKSVPEHDEMRRVIGALRAMQPSDPEHDLRFMELMRDVMHHVADEETVLLPAAELLLHDRLSELGAQMTKRRIELAGPHVGTLAASHARAMPATTMMLAAGGLLLGGLLARGIMGHRPHSRW